MGVPGDVWIFVRVQANSFSTEWADEDSHILLICIWTLMRCITSVLKAKDVVAAVAGEGQEVDLVAVADAAVLAQVGELRRPHPGTPEGGGGYRFALAAATTPLRRSAAASR